MSTEQNKAVLRRWMEGLNTRNVMVIDVLVDEVFTTDFILHANAQPGYAIGRGGVKKHVRDVLMEMPDRQFTTFDLFAETDKVVLRASVSGTDASTGESVSSHAIGIYRFVGTNIAELWQISTETEAKP